MPASDHLSQAAPLRHKHGPEDRSNTHRADQTTKRLLTSAIPDPANLHRYREPRICSPPSVRTSKGEARVSRSRCRTDRACRHVANARPSIGQHGTCSHRRASIRTGPTIDPPCARKSGPVVHALRAKRARARRGRISETSQEQVCPVRGFNGPAVLIGVRRALSSLALEPLDCRPRGRRWTLDVAWHGSVSAVGAASDLVCGCDDVAVEPPYAELIAECV
jgi:hypothetical protein